MSLIETVLNQNSTLLRSNCRLRLYQTNAIPTQDISLFLRKKKIALTIWTFILTYELDKKELSWDFCAKMLCDVMWTNGALWTLGHTQKLTFLKLASVSNGVKRCVDT